ncbi:MAG: carbon-nitrogen hydrolase, partial [Gemmatimonadetes bacterium]|nr:carbon-nitrogen hydrolase [Gemmatimonadota bacterium]
AAAARAGADLLLTPELSLTGYDLRDAAAELAVPVQVGAQFGSSELAAAGAVVVGLVEQGEAGPYNAAVHLRAGCVLFRHRKLYLPTYGMFDEGRFYARGDRLDAYELGGGWRAGLIICEDFWHPALAYILAGRGIHLLMVQAAAPGRGVWQGGEEGGRFASWDAWERIARTTAQLYGIYVALANRVGIEEGVTFAGGSLIVGPAGDVLARAPAEGEATLALDLSLDALARARRPYAHLRDDDPGFTLRELRRTLEAATDGG